MNKNVLIGFLLLLPCAAVAMEEVSDEGQQAIEENTRIQKEILEQLKVANYLKALEIISKFMDPNKKVSVHDLDVQRRVIFQKKPAWQTGAVLQMLRKALQ